LGAAIVAEARARGLNLSQPTTFGAVVGHGIDATIDGRRVLVGKAALLEGAGIDAVGLRARAEPLAAAGRTPMLVAVDGRPAGVIAVADRVRGQSREAVVQLRTLGLTIAMITGDNERTAAAVAREVGIDRVFAEVLPEDKAAHVKRL